jgi:DNA invertase Pin-like site-specific DNA recombinase
MTNCYEYLRTSGDDGGTDKCGLPVQQQACDAFARAKGFEVVETFSDDGWSGKIHLHARPAGKRLIVALLGNGVKMVIVYQQSRIGRTQPVIWRAIELFRDNGIVVYDHNGNNLCESVQGGINALLAEMDYDATVKRLRDGKNACRAKDGRRTDGRWPFGMHPDHKYDAEREVVTRIKAWAAEGVSRYRITKNLNDEGILTRYGKPFRESSIKIILDGRKGGYKQ